MRYRLTNHVHLYLKLWRDKCRRRAFRGFYNERWFCQSFYTDEMFFSPRLGFGVPGRNSTFMLKNTVGIICHILLQKSRKKRREKFLSSKIKTANEASPSGFY
jgi:hypothetical protein